MYKPLFNQVLVEIDDIDAKWGKGSDDNIGGEVYREGKLLEAGAMFATADYPISPEELSSEVEKIIGKPVMWNEGHEAGKIFDEDGKKYALVYWWDLVAVKDQSND